MVKKLRNIIVGNWRNITGYKSDKMKRRLAICKDCESNVRYLGNRICSECGCILKAKAAVEDEKCLKNKWHD